MLLAVAMVTSMQLVDVLPVLRTIRIDADAQADRAVSIGGAILDEIVGNRNEVLATALEALALDFGLREAVAQGDPDTIRSTLENHAGRARADLALVADLDGTPIASLSIEREPGRVPSLEDFDAMGGQGTMQSLIFFGDVPYLTVSSVIRAPLPEGIVLFGFEIDENLAEHIANLTRLQVTLLDLRDTEPRAVQTTVADEMQEAALASIRSASAGGFSSEPLSDPSYLTLVRPLYEGIPELQVALQLSMEQARQSYVDVRNNLLAVAGLALLAVIAGAAWVASSVTRPVDKLAAAARRMKDGIYTEPVAIESQDELGELADGFNAMQTAISEREQHIFHVAHHDALTGLPNRQMIVTLLNELIESEQPFKLIHIGIVRFNKIVASLGYRTSDRIIYRVAASLRGIIAEGQKLGHVNGAEFVLILPDADEPSAFRRVDEIRRILHSGIDADGASLSLLSAAGISSYPEHTDSAAGLLHRASIARTEAETAHEPAVVYRKGQEAQSLKQIKIVGDFPAALENDELEPWFQPKIDCSSGRVVGAEALVRWQHPRHGLLTPFDFVDAIEQAGGISHLTRWMLRACIAECRKWRDMGHDLGVASNISVDDLTDEYLPYYLLDLTREYEVEPSVITLEVTESAIMHNVHKSLSVISCIHDLGFRVAIDDFGTGHSSLSQLRRLPVDELKIDKSFIQDFSDERDEAIVLTAIELAHRLRLDVVAEGVEELATLDKLAAMGAHFAQGYAFARPLPRDSFEPWCRNWDLAALRRLGGQVRRISS